MPNLFDDSPEFKNPATGLPTVQNPNAPQIKPGNIFDVPNDFVAQKAAEEPKGFWGGVYEDVKGIVTHPLDSLARPLHASAKFVDVAASQGIDHLGDALLAGAQEIAHPTDPITYMDVMERNFPDVVKEHWATAGVLATMGDLFIDPLNLVSFGTGGAIRASGVALSKKGVGRLGKILAEVAGESGEALNLASDAVRTVGNRTIADKIIAQQALVDSTLQDLGGFKIAGITVIPGKTIKAFNDLTGITVLKDAIKEIPAVKATREAFNRWANIPIEYQNMTRKLAADSANAERDGLQEAMREFGTMSKEDGIKVGETGLKIRDETVLAGQAKEAQVTAQQTAAQQGLQQAQTKLTQAGAEDAYKVLLRDEKKAPIQWTETEKGTWVDTPPSNVDVYTGKPIKDTNPPRVAVAAPQKVFDMDGPMDLSLLARVKKTLRLPEDDATFNALATSAGDFKTNGDLYKALVNYFGEGRIKNYEWLREGGYDAIRSKVNTTSKLEALDEGIIHPAFGDSANAMKGMDSATAAAEQAKQLSPALTTQEALNIQRQVLDAAKLNPQQLAAYSKATRRFKDIQMLEIEAGLLKQATLNYWPRTYKNIEDGEKFTFLLKQKGLGNFLGSSQETLFNTLAEARAAGFEPVLDAGVLYAKRVIDSGKALAKDEFKRAVYHTFGEGTFDNLPRRIKEDITYIGEGLYPKGMSEARRYFLQSYDGMTNLFKKAATVMRPYFGVKQGLIANPLQSYLAIGTKAFRAYDPRTVADSITLLMHDTGVFTDAEKGLGWAISTNLGEKLTGKQILDAAYRQNIFQKTTQNGERLKTTIEHELGWYRATHNTEGDLDVAKGAATLIKGAAKYWNFPAHVEDIGRGSLFINALRLGHSEEAAGAITRKGLFDYAEGISEWERRIAKRIVPFYSYQRFLYPLLKDALFSHPARIENVDKAVSSFLKVMPKFESNDKLNDSERWALGSWLLDQPNYFAKFDEKSQAAFRTFNNYSFLDNMAWVKNDEVTKDIDWKTSIGHTILAQVAPFLKAPLELYMNKNFFTDRALTAGGRLGDLSKITELFPTQVRDYIFENGIDKRTGKMNTYINWFAAYALQNTFPVITDLIRLNRPENTPLEKTMQTIFGINTIKVDIKAQAKFKVLNQNKEADDAKKEARNAYLQGRPSEFDKRLQQYRDVAEAIKNNRAGVNFQDIRGAEKEEQP